MKPFTVYMVGMIDATDEEYNLAVHALTLGEGDTAGDAWMRMLRHEYEECWDPEDWDLDEEDNGRPLNPFETYVQWMDCKLWIPSITDPWEAVRLQNDESNKHVFEHGWMYIGDALRVVEALKGAADILSGGISAEDAEGLAVKRWREIAAENVKRNAGK